MKTFLISVACISVVLDASPVLRSGPFGIPEDETMDYPDSRDFGITYLNNPTFGAGDPNVALPRADSSFDKDEEDIEEPYLRVIRTDDDDHPFKVVTKNDLADGGRSVVEDALVPDAEQQGPREEDEEFFNIEKTGDDAYPLRVVSKNQRKEPLDVETENNLDTDPSENVNYRFNEVSDYKDLEEGSPLVDADNSAETTDSQVSSHNSKSTNEWGFAIPRSDNLSKNPLEHPYFYFVSHNQAVQYLQKERESVPSASELRETVNEPLEEEEEPEESNVNSVSAWDSFQKTENELGDLIPMEQSPVKEPVDQEMNVSKDGLNDAFFEPAPEQDSIESGFEKEQYGVVDEEADEEFIKDSAEELPNKDKVYENPFEEPEENPFEATEEPTESILEANQGKDIHELQETDGKPVFNEPFEKDPFFENKVDEVMPEGLAENEFLVTKSCGGEIVQVPEEIPVSDGQGISEEISLTPAEKKRVEEALKRLVNREGAQRKLLFNNAINEGKCYPTLYAVKVRMDYPELFDDGAPIFLRGWKQFVVRPFYAIRGKLASGDDAEKWKNKLEITNGLWDSPESERRRASIAYLDKINSEREILAAKYPEFEKYAPDYQ